MMSKINKRRCRRHCCGNSRGNRCSDDGTVYSVCESARYCQLGAVKQVVRRRESWKNWACDDLRVKAKTVMLKRTDLPTDDVANHSTIQHLHYSDRLQLILRSRPNAHQGKSCVERNSDSRAKKTANVAPIVHVIEMYALYL